jgi:hypothetical protein
MTKIQNTDTSQELTGKVGEQYEFSLIACSHAKWYSHFGRKVGSFIQKEIHSYHIIQHQVPRYLLN